MLMLCFARFVGCDMPSCRWMPAQMQKTCWQFIDTDKTDSMISRGKKGIIKTTEFLNSGITCSEIENY